MQTREQVLLRIKELIEVEVIPKIEYTMGYLYLSGAIDSTAYDDEITPFKLPRILLAEALRREAAVQAPATGADKQVFKNLQYI